MFNNRKDILEFHDLHALHELELVVENGVQYVRALFSIDPHRPAFEGDEKPNLLLLTNGSSTRMYGVEEKPQPASEADAPADAPANTLLSTENSAESAAAAPKRVRKAVVDSVTPAPDSAVASEVVDDSSSEAAENDASEPAAEVSVDEAPKAE